MGIKSVGLLVAAFVAIPSAPADAQRTSFAPVDISQAEVAPGVHQFTVAVDGYVEQLNSVAIVTDAGVVLFDTTTRPSTAREIVRRIRKITARPVRYVVNSHWHPDHWSGNEVLAAEFPGVEFVATEKERDFMINMSALWPDYLPKALAGQENAIPELLASGKDENRSPLTPASRQRIERELQLVRDLVAEQLKVRRTYPTLTYTDRMTLRFGGREIQLISVTGDAAATTVLYLPEDKVLITGDAVSYPLPYYTPPLSDHARSLRQLAALDAEVIVPGHGPAFRDKAYMLLEAELFEDVLRQVQAALRGGAVSIDDVQAQVNFEPFAERFARGDAAVARQFPAFVKGMVRKAYIELRDSKEIR